MISKIFSLSVILARPAFFLALITVTFLSLWPGSASPPTLLWSDKFNHAMAYFFLTIGLIVGWKFTLKNRLIAIVSLFAWGVVLEIIQGLPLVSRTASGMDLVANASGILLAMLVGWLFSFWHQRKFEP
ncbi:MAG: hypothetical protein COA60_002550 [Robiginitomaculum sp.]|nr:hypothetical protein [Robiginitomaculum sp.]